MNDAQKIEEVFIGLGNAIRYLAVGCENMAKHLPPEAQAAMTQAIGQAFNAIQETGMMTGVWCDAEPEDDDIPQA